MNTYISSILAVLLLSASSCTAPKTAEKKASPQAVRSTEVRVGSMVQGSTHLAEVVPERIVKVIARVPGTVTTLAIAEGSGAVYGTALARVSAPDVAARVARIHSERKRAERERDFVCSTLKTDRVLAQSGDLASIQLDRSERACASAKLAVDGAKAGEREASVAKARSVERAPFDGEVLMHLVDVGQSVMPGSPILQWASRERLLRINVPDSDLQGLEVGGSISSNIGQGKILSIGAQAMGPGRVIELLVKMDSKIDLRVGTTLNATLVVKQAHNASSVPLSALGGNDSANYLMLIEKNKLRRYPVLPGVTENGWVAFTPPLPKGTQVVNGAVSSLDPAGAILVVTP